MTANDLQRVLRAFNRRRPFRPFWFEFHSGDRVKVVHPEIVEKSGNLFGFREPNGAYRLFAADSVCQVLEQPAENS